MPPGPARGAAAGAEQTRGPVAGSVTGAEQGAEPVAGSVTGAEQGAEPVAGSVTGAERGAEPARRDAARTDAFGAATPTARRAPGTAAYRLAAAHLLRRLRRHAVEAVRWASERWRRSLQLRVATTTLLVSTLVVVVVGILLVNSITAGLLDAKQKAAYAEVKDGLRVAEDQLSVLVSVDDPDSLQRTLRTVTQDLAGPGTNAGLFSIALVSEGEQRQTFASGDV